MENFNYKVEWERKRLENLYVKLPRYLLIFSAFCRIVIVISICIYQYWSYKSEQQGLERVLVLSIQILISVISPLILEAMFVMFSIVTSKLIQARQVGWALFFYVCTAGGFIYNWFHIIEFVDTIKFIEENYLVTIFYTLVVLNIAGLVGSEAAGLLLVLDETPTLLNHFKTETSESAPTESDTEALIDGVYKYQVWHEPNFQALSMEEFERRYQQLYPEFEKIRNPEQDSLPFSELARITKGISDKPLKKVYTYWASLNPLRAIKTVEDQFGRILTSETQYLNGTSRPIHN